jgi:DNA-binding Lrp family transcriptional regulator
VDPTDLAILNELARDGRISMNDLAGKVNLSRAHTYRRVEALVSSGLIRSFTIDIDPEQTGLKVAAVVLVEAVQDRWAEVHDMVRAMPRCPVRGRDHRSVRYGIGRPGGFTRRATRDRPRTSRSR